MKIIYKNNSIEKVCIDIKEAKRKHGEVIAKRIHNYIRVLESFDNVESIIENKIGRCHRLKGERKGEYAMDLGHPYRLIFEEVDGRIKVVKILEIVDYH